MNDTKPDHALAESNARELLEKTGTVERFAWVPTNLASAYLASQAENADLDERVRGLENAVRGLLSVVEHCDHYQETNYRQCHESRVADCALEGIYVGPVDENGRLAKPK